jgi:hypothetical protein
MIVSDYVVSLQGTIKWRQLPRAVFKNKMNKDISVHIAPSCVSQKSKVLGANVPL